MLPHSEMIIRIAAGALLGGVIGFERDLHGRHVGLRTHLIVSMASATFMVLSAHFAFYQGYGEGGPFHVEVDASRIAASVVSGIGFLAGGAILRTGGTVQGLTTAAGLWLVTAIGLCAGAGMYIESGAVTLMGVIALTTLRKFEDKNDQLIRRHITLSMEDAEDAVGRIFDLFSKRGVKVSDFDYEKRVDQRTLAVHFEAKIPVSLGVPGFIREIEGLRGVRQLNVKLHE